MMVYIRYAFVCLIFGVIGFFWAKDVPRLKFWILDEIEYVTKYKGDFQIKAKNFQFHLFPPGIEFKKIYLTPRNELANVTSPIEINSLGVYLNVEALISGRFEVEKIVLTKPTADIRIANKKSDSPTVTKIFDWDQLMGFPIHGITLTQANIGLSLKEPELQAHFPDITIHLEKNFRAAKLEIIAPELSIESKVLNDTLHLGFMTRVILEKQAVELAAVKIALGKNYVIARGLGRGDVTRLDLPLLSGRMISKTELSEVEALATKLFPKLELPALQGNLETDITVRGDRGHEPEVGGEIKGHDLKVSKFVVGDLSTRFQMAKNTVRTNQIEVKNSSGKIRFENTSVGFAGEHKVSAKVVFDPVELRQFLDNIGVDDVPLHMDIEGTIPCEGTMTPLKMNCAGEVRGKNFTLWSEKFEKDAKGREIKSKLISKKTIVALDSFKITAQMGIDKDHVWWPKGLLSLGDSQGVAEGSVSYRDGFSFSYKSDHLDFKNIKSLADLKFEGAIGIEGTTRGTGHMGVIKANVSTPEFWFENYGLGNSKFGFAYEDGLLKFDNIDGTNGNLKYSGQAVVRVNDVPGKPVGVESAHVDIPVLDINDLQTKVFGKKVQLPFSSQGRGSATLDASGPFALSKLSYTLKSTASHAVVAGESFEALRFNVHGVNGHAFADDVYIRKGHGNFAWSGDVNPDGIMNVKIRGQDLHITDFEHAHPFAAQLDGILSTTISLTDYILAPKLSIDAKTTQVSLNQVALADSSFNVTLNAAALKLNGRFFDDKVFAKIVYPFKNGEPFSFKFRADNWDFSSFLNFLSKTPRRDYETAISADIDIENKDGKFWDSNGRAIFSRLYIRHGNSQMRTLQPVFVKFDDGLVTMTPSHIAGDNTQLTFMGTKNKKGNLNFNVNGQVDLSLLIFLTPFFRDMTGELSLSAQLGGSLQKIDLLGSAYIKNGYFKLDALPHPFENINADMLFSQTRVLVNHLKGHLGGGDLSASGSVLFNSLFDVPIKIDGTLLHANLSVPEGVATKGDFHYSLTGDWFPYLLQGDYLISEGNYTRNFGDSNDNGNLKRSSYLPAEVLKKDFSPLEVDVSAHFPKSMMVKNNMMDAEVRGELEITGEPTAPGLKGDISGVPGGKIFFRETPFTITDCKVSFNNPNEFNPSVYIVATSRVRDWDVNLIVQGTMQKYKAQLTSTPPLTEKSIISLLALGVTEEDEARAQQALMIPNSLASVQATQSQAQAQSYEAGNLLLQDNPLEKEVKQRFGVNVRLSSRYDDTTSRVMPTIVAEKQWTPRVSTSVSRTMGDYVTQNAVLEYKLDRHFSLLGSFEQREYDPYSAAYSSTNYVPAQNIFGLDLQFQVNFK